MKAEDAGKVKVAKLQLNKETVKDLTDREDREKCRTRTTQVNCTGFRCAG